MYKIAMYSTSKLYGNRITGGLKRFLELYHGLSDKGYNVDLYSSDSQEVLDKNNVKGYSLNETKESKRVFFPAELRIMLMNIDLIRKIKSHNYDFVIVFDVPTAFSLCIMNVKKIQLFLRQDLIGYKKISMESRIKNKFLLNIYLKILSVIEGICLKKADKIIVQCEYDLVQIIERHKIIKKKIERKTSVQINNVNPEWIQAASANYELNPGTNSFMKSTNEDKFWIAFIGDFSNDRKGHRIFIDALKNLINMHYKVAAILMGDGKQLDDYIEECMQYKDIKFLGRVSSPVEIIKKCDLVVVPSIADSCPNTIMESLYNEVPVIGASAGGIPEILVNPKYMFNPTSMDLEAKIIEMLDPDLKQKVQSEQKVRKGELSFNWTDKIINILF